MRTFSSSPVRPETPSRTIARLFAPLDPQAHLDDQDHEDDERDGEGAVERDGNEQRERPYIPIGEPVGVLGIFGPQLREALVADRDLPRPRDILPRSQPWRPGEVVPGTVIVVDRAALAEGPWAGVETASGTRLAGMLLSFLDSARDAGGQVVLLDHARPRNVNTNLLVERSDVSLPDADPVDEVLGERPRSALMTLLQHVAIQQTRNSGVTA